jgi:hypothetical protein
VDAVAVYEMPNDGPLRQGEILSNMRQLEAESVEGSGEFSARPIIHPFAVILSQDCDLEWDYQNRMADAPEANSKNLPNILFCEISEASELRNQSNLKSDQWKKVRQNNDSRYQFLEGCPPELDATGEGFTDLAADFKRYFTIRTSDVYSQLKFDARRRTRLKDAYCAHLSTRFYHFQLRIALPREHGQPAPKEG